MSKKDLKLTSCKMRQPGSTKQTDDWWFYEEKYGLSVIRQPCSIATEAIIPLRAIRAYLKRLDK